MSTLEIQATERYTQHPLRYTEASLVKKMEELGIGRPSTYAPTISTISNRGYILKDDRKGEEKTITQLILQNGTITTTTRREVFGSEKGKLCPENIGIVVTDFLASHFPDILDYGFTAHVEESFDAIAAGQQAWVPTIRLFYGPFHQSVENTTQEAAPTKAERELGVDPKTGKTVTARIGRFGPLVQIGTNDDPDKKFASLTKGQLIENITLEEALQLFALPRQLGEWQEKPVSCAIGRFGPYVKYGSNFVSLGKQYDPYTITLEEAIGLIQAHEEKNAKKEILDFPEAGIQVLNGRFGPYIKQGKNNYKIPKDTDPQTLTLEACQQIIQQTPTKAKK
jgi:DNA topoisomerase-1